MSWCFVRGALGFSDSWICWIMAAIESPKFGIKVNGKITNWIEGKSGRCPLSLSLFIICTEILTRMIRREESLGYIHGIRPTSASAPISHLFFAECSSFLVPLSCMSILQQFCSNSGQCINRDKSLVMLSKRTKAPKRTVTIQTLGLQEGREMGRYLGVPLVTSRIAPCHFADLQAARIGGWKNRLLSFAA